MSPNHTYTENGTFTVCLTATNVYDEATTCHDVTVTNVGILDVAFESSVNIYPTLSYGNVTVELLNNQFTNVTAEVYNMMGEKLIEQLINTNKSQLDISQFEGGNYILKINSDVAKFEKYITLVK